MNDHISNAAIIVFGLCASLIGHLFDVPPSTLWVAAIGSSLGVAFSKESSFCKAFSLILVGTLLTGWAVPFVLKYAPDLAQKSVAAFLPLIVISFRGLIAEELPKILASIFARIHDTIRGTKP